jgi:hypothetical protein
MKKTIFSEMKDKVIVLIKVLGMGFNELVIDIDLGELVFNSIEWDKEEDCILLHIFEDDIDYTIDFEDLTDKQQYSVYRQLSFVWN